MVMDRRNMLCFVFRNLSRESKAHRLISHVIITWESNFVVENMFFKSPVFFMFVDDIIKIRLFAALGMCGWGRPAGL